MSGTSNVRPLNVTRPLKRETRAVRCCEQLVLGFVPAQEELPRVEPAALEVAAAHQERQRPGAAAQARRLEVEEQQRARGRRADAPVIVASRPRLAAPLQAAGPRPREAPRPPARSAAEHGQRRQAARERLARSRDTAWRPCVSSEVVLALEPDAAACHVRARRRLVRRARSATRVRTRGRVTGRGGRGDVRQRPRLVASHRPAPDVAAGCPAGATQGGSSRAASPAPIRASRESPARRPWPWRRRRRAGRRTTGSPTRTGTRR